MACTVDIKANNVPLYSMLRLKLIFWRKQLMNKRFSFLEPMEMCTARWQSKFLLRVSNTQVREVPVYLAARQPLLLHKTIVSFHKTKKYLYYRLSTMKKRFIPTYMYFLHSNRNNLSLFKIVNQVNFWVFKYSLVFALNGLLCPSSDKLNCSLIFLSRLLLIY